MKSEEELPLGYPKPYVTILCWVVCELSGSVSFQLCKGLVTRISQRDWPTFDLWQQVRRRVKH